jgi:hypothetical protein
VLAVYGGLTVPDVIAHGERLVDFVSTVNRVSLIEAVETDLSKQP